MLASFDSQKPGNTTRPDHPHAPRASFHESLTNREASPRATRLPLRTPIVGLAKRRPSLSQQEHPPSKAVRRQGHILMSGISQNHGSQGRPYRRIRPNNTHFATCPLLARTGPPSSPEVSPAVVLVRLLSVRRPERGETTRVGETRNPCYSSLSC